MKNNKSLFIYIIAYLSILIPLPGRFVYGIVLMLELFLLTIAGTTVNSVINRMKLEQVKSISTIIVLISFAIFYRQIIAAIYPEIALVLGFVFYLIPISSFLLNSVYDDFDKPLKERLIINIKFVLVFILFSLLFFLFRDMAGFGTFTFFGKNHQIYEKVLLNPEGVGIFTFFASIPGALFLAGLIIFIQIVINTKFNILKNSEDVK